MAANNLRWSEVPYHCWDYRALIRLCEIVPKSFNNIKHIKLSPIRISLFYYDTTYSLG